MPLVEYEKWNNHIRGPETGFPKTMKADSTQ
jgi:hypothetical protein